MYKEGLVSYMDKKIGLPIYCCLKKRETVGRAIKRSSVPREELFITTKLLITDTNYAGAKRGFQNSLDV
jgi:diketogulonate reductase-like aldo/keto reductase